MLQHRLATPVIQPRMHFFDKDGKPLIGGKVYSFKVDEDVFKPTYRNSEFTAANQNPVLLDQAGSALVYVRGSVRLKIYDKSGVFIESRIEYQQQEQVQFFDQYSKPLAYGKVWTYDYQSTIKKTSYYTDSTANPNPVVLDADGKAIVYIVGAYRLRQFDKNGVFVCDQDFKRPPVRVLTSRVYPVFSSESMQSYCELNEFNQVNAVFDLECAQSQVGLESIKFRTPLNSYECEPTLTSATCSFVGIKVLIVRDQNQKAEIKPESTQGNCVFNQIKITREIRYITHIAEIQNSQSSCILAGIKVTNI